MIDRRPAGQKIKNRTFKTYPGCEYPFLSCLQVWLPFPNAVLQPPLTKPSFHSSIALKLVEALRQRMVTASLSTSRAAMLTQSMLPVACLS